MDWSVIAALGGVAIAFAVLLMAVIGVGITRLGSWLASQGRPGGQPEPTYEGQAGIAKAALRPLLKGELWSLAILAFALGISRLISFVAPPTSSLFFLVLAFLFWVALLIATAWQVIVRRHKTAGWGPALLAVAAAVLPTLLYQIPRLFSIYSGLSGLCASFFAAGAWQMLVGEHKTTGRILAGIAIMAALLCVFFLRVAWITPPRGSFGGAGLGGP